MKPMWHLRDRVFWVCLLIATAFLIAGFGITGHWEGSLAGLGIAIISFRIRNKGNLPVSTGYLLLHVGMAATGLIIGCSPFLMVNGTIAALGVWDATQFQRGIDEGENRELVRLLERRHFQSLGLALGLAFFVSTVGLFVQVQLPFGVIMLLLLMTLFSLTRLYRLVKN